MRAYLRALCAVVLCGMAHPLEAHVPFLEESDASEEQPYPITTALEKSIAIYAGLGGQDAVDVFEFTVTEEDSTKQRAKIHAGLLTPRCKAHQLFLPTLFVIGPAQAAIPEPTDALRRRIGVTIPKGYGAIAVPQEALENRDASSFFEEYTGTWYWWEHKLDLYVDKPGVYRVVVQTNRKEPGDYVLEFGDQEQWIPADWERAGMLMPLLREHREIRSAECRLEVGT